MARAQGVPLAGPVEQAVPSHGGGLVRRLLSTLILLPLFVWMVASGPVWLFGAVMVLAGALGQWEFTGMFERAGVRTFRVLGLVGGSLVTASFALPVSERVAFTAVLLGAAHGRAAAAAGRIARPGSRWRSPCSASAT